VEDTYDAERGRDREREGEATEEHYDGYTLCWGMGHGTGLKGEKGGGGVAAVRTT
jgi:hypothetical protein